MKIIDSSLWIEYFLGNEIDISIIDAIEDKSNLCVPIICLFEVHKKFLSINEVKKSDLSISFMQDATVINLTPQIAILAAKLSKQYQLPMQIA